MTVIRLIARPMLASMFVVGGINSLKNAKAMAPAAQPVADRFVPVAQKAVPQAPIPTDAATLVRINGAVHVAAGLALATGRAPRLSSTLLAASLVPTTLAGHRFWEESEATARTQQKLHFFKNVSVLGGLIIASFDTEGQPGMAWRARRAAADVRRETKQLAKDARREARLAKARVA